MFLYTLITVTLPAIIDQLFVYKFFDALNVWYLLWQTVVVEVVVSVRNFAIGVPSLEAFFEVISSTDLDHSEVLFVPEHVYEAVHPVCFRKGPADLQQERFRNVTFVAVPILKMYENV